MTTFTDFYIREATKADITAIEQIYRYYVLETLVTMEEIPPTLEELTHRMECSVSRNLPYFVAHTIEAEIVGFAYAAPYRNSTRSAYRFTVEDSVYIDKDFAGKGIGYALLHRLIVECSQRQFKQMIAVIGHGDNQASIDLHSKLGFEPIGCFKGVGIKFGNSIDSIIMQRALTDE